MAKKDGTEHLKTYETFCAPRFNAVEASIGSLDNTVMSLNAIVNDGLKEKVVQVSRQVSWLFVVFVSLLISIAGSTTILYLSNARSRQELKAEIIYEIQEASR